MIHEYAIDPESLAEFNAVWQALEQCGISHGRVISSFPRRWQKEVQKAINVEVLS